MVVLLMKMKRATDMQKVFWGKSSGTEYRIFPNTCIWR